MKKLMIFTALATMASVSYAVAKDGGHHNKDRGHKMFERHDTNGDGVISKSEFIASAEERFKKMDADENGEITKDEAKKHYMEMKEKWKSKKDKYHDNH